MDSMIKILLLAALCTALILAAPEPAAASDVNVSVTIAVGGIACGVYFFVSYSVGHTSGWQPVQTEATALFNHGPEGWQIGYPRLKLVEDGHSAYAPYVEIINLRF